MADDLAPALLKWYDRVARPLPWRIRTDPYRVLLSELLCQQTRVDTAIPYYERFLARWPTMEALASADEAEVLAMWAGLGYYSRARNLLAAARAAVALGGLPSDPAQLRELPGIGPYTAGAIASIAFGVAAPAVDGNVERVISRLDAIEDDPKGKAAREAITRRVVALHAAANSPSRLTQALMELGATACSPKSPSCMACPWMASCKARLRGDPETFPRKPAKKASPEVRGIAAVHRDPRGTWLGKRPPGGLLASMWEPPCAPIGDEDPAEVLPMRIWQQTGAWVRPAERLGEVTHVFSHRRLILTVFAVEPSPPLASEALPSLDQPVLPAYVEARMADPDDPALALSTLARKVLAR